jgi:ATP-binding cassette subfamily B protein
MLKFLKYLKPYWWMILLLFAGLSLQVWSALQLPDIMAQIVNNGIVAQDLNYIEYRGLMMLGVALVGGVGMIIAGFFASRIGTGFSRDIRNTLFKKILSFSISEIDKFSTASLINRTTNDIQQIQQTLVMVLRMSLQAPLMAAGAIFKAFETAPSMAWIIALSIAVLLAIFVTVMFIALPKFNIIQKLNDRLNRVTRENLTGLRVVRAFNNEKYEERKFQVANDEVTRVNLFVSRVMSVTMPFVQLIFNCTTLLIIWVGAHAIEEGAIEIGNMMAFMQYAIQVIMSFMFLTMAFIIAPRAVVSWKRLREVLDTKLSIKPAKHPQKPSQQIRGQVEFKNVSFKYHGADKPVLKNISFKTESGTTTALIGSTGSGKSTLINLIPRFYDVTAGEVLVDGIDVKNYADNDLMDKLGYVPQKGVLFSGTVASNIAFGMAKPNQKQIAQAAEVAQAADFIKKLDKQFDAPIAQGGSNVSGGQKQRLSIARAIARDPEIYIFDDSFSALDFKTDLKLREALKKVTKDSAVIIVAQRIGTIKHADQIIVLDEGQVVGRGTHYELLETCPVYREIARSQFSDSELKAELKTAKTEVKSSKTPAKPKEAKS